MERIYIRNYREVGHGPGFDIKVGNSRLGVYNDKTKVCQNGNCKTKTQGNVSAGLDRSL